MIKIPTLFIRDETQRGRPVTAQVVTTPGPDLRAQRPVTIGLAQCDKATWPSGVLCALIGHSNAQHIHVLSPPDPTIYGWWACNRCCALRLEQPR